MPSGKIHDRITLWTLPVVVGSAYYVTRDSHATLLIGGGFLFGGLMFGPDLDIYSVQYKRWGWLRWLWLPYQRGMPHRSPLSHFPIIGTCFRVIYLFVWIALFGGIVIGLLNTVGQFSWTWEAAGQVLLQSWKDAPMAWIALLVGLELGACSHYLADWTGSTVGRLQKKGLRGLLPPQPRKKRRTRKRDRRQRH